jgi:hypothetical protein
MDSDSGDIYSANPRPSLGCEHERTCDHYPLGAPGRAIARTGSRPCSLMEIVGNALERCGGQSRSTTPVATVTSKLSSRLALTRLSNHD